MSNGNIKKFQKNKGYESLSRSMLQDTDNLSLQAIGLLAYLTSLPDDWQIHKTELYKRFKLNGKKSVATAWNHLVSAGYILQFKIRNGKRFDYKYYHFHEPFNKEDIQSIEQSEGYKAWDGTKENSSVSLDISSNAQKVHPTNDSSNAPFELPILNFPKGAYNKLTNKQITHKDIDTLDTENRSYPQKQNQNIKTKEDYMNEAFYKNNESVPEEIAAMLKAFFGDDTDRSEKAYQTILKAKKKLQKEIGVVIWLEHDPETIRVIIQAFSLAIRKVERESVIKSPEGYVFTSVYKALANHFQEFH